MRTGTYSRSSHVVIPCSIGINHSVFDDDALARTVLRRSYSRRTAITCISIRMNGYILYVDCAAIARFVSSDTWVTVRRIELSTDGDYVICTFGSDDQRASLFHQDACPAGGGHGTIAACHVYGGGAVSCDADRGWGGDVGILQIDGAEMLAFSR